MKFSLRQLAVIFIILSLAFALGVAFSRLRKLENEYLSLQEQIGYKRKAHGAEDHFQLATLGDNVGTARTLTGTHVIRVDSHEQYSVELTFYDGATKDTHSQMVALNDPIVAITYLPYPSQKMFYVQSTYMVRQQTRHEFHVNTHDTVAGFGPWGASGPITSECILYYWFCPSASEPTAPNAFEEQGLTPDRMFALCDRYGIQTTFVRIVRRDSTSNPASANKPRS
jgi:hypothetical protein